VARGQKGHAWYQRGGLNLDGIIGLSKLSLTVVFGLMVRSSRTMTARQGDTPFDTLF
jgi:cell division inhibitor SulA